MLAASHAAVPQATAIAYLDHALQAVVVVRTAEGDPRVLERDWARYAPAQQAMRDLDQVSSARWGKIVYVPDIDAHMLTVSMPVRIDGAVTGAFVATMELATLSQYLDRIATPHGATPFVLQGREQVLAHPRLGQPDATRAGVTSVPTLADLADPVMALLREVAERRPLPQGLLNATGGFDAYLVAAEGHDYAIVMQPLGDFGALAWTIGCYFAVTQLREDFRKLRYGAIGGGVVLVVALIFAGTMSRGIRRPINRLARASEALQADGLGAVRPLAGSRLLELDLAARTFNGMVEGLRDRERIRETFGKYVPAELAEAILADRGALRPQTREATVLFTDIVEFSTLSERMPPKALIELLNQYFAVVVEPIQRCSGVIHQFQGDAMLATFNLPLDDPQHAAHAVAAALEIQTALTATVFKLETGNVELRTRVGINTGTVVGGSVGSESRLGYTVHGDDVNLAARIEQLNKAYGTAILVSAATRNAAGDAFEFEAIGVTPVRGREQPVTLYEPIRAS